MQRPCSAMPGKCKSRSTAMAAHSPMALPMPTRQYDRPLRASCALPRASDRALLPSFLASRRLVTQRHLGFAPQLPGKRPHCPTAHRPTPGPPWRTHRAARRCPSQPFGAASALRHWSFSAQHPRNYALPRPRSLLEVSSRGANVTLPDVESKEAMRKLLSRGAERGRGGQESSIF